MPSIFDLTDDLVELYLYHCGQSEIPQPFHVWSCLALAAACLGSRVYIRKLEDEPLKPNLYVFLLGPSALGKNVAINAALKFLDAAPVKMYKGRITGPRILDKLGKRQTVGDQTVILASEMFFVTPELQMSVRKGDLAAELIAIMTELYSGTGNIEESTRTSGDVLVKDPCITWLAGTTSDWMIESIPRTAIEGGFLGRTVCIAADYNLALRYRRPIMPPDRQAVVEALAKRFVELTAARGEVTLTGEAEELEGQWYDERPAPIDDSLIPSWKREHDLILKLMTILALASRTYVATPTHFTKARQLAAQAMRSVPSIIQWASQTADTEKLEIVARRIQRAGQMQHSVLLRDLSKRGIDAKMLKERIIPTLQQERRIDVTHNGNGLVYTWRSRRAVRAAEGGDES